jgi:peroxiredoxin
MRLRLTYFDSTLVRVLFHFAALSIALNTNVTGSLAKISIPILAQSAAQPLVAKTIDGRTIDIGQTAGWRVVYFWSSACPCVRACERYSFIPLANKYAGRVSFYAVASDGWELGMTHAQLAGLIAQHHLPYAVLVDRDHSVAKALGAKVTPQTFVIDPSGNIVFDGMPDDSRRFIWDPPKPQSGKPVPVPSSYLAVALAQGLSGKPVTETPLKQAGCSISW